MATQIIKFFEKLGFSQKETEIFTSLYKLGTQPASTIARYVNVERTTVYKILLRLAKEGLIGTTQKHGTKQFFVADIGVVKSYIENKLKHFQSLEKGFDEIKSDLKNIKLAEKSYIPKISLYDGIDGIKNIYSDMYENIIQNGFISIKFFASNVFQEQIASNPDLKHSMKDFFDKMTKKNITVDTFLGNGILIMEHISRSTLNAQILDQLPAGNSATNIFVIGKSLYLIIFKDIPLGLKIDSEELVYCMHFLFDNLKISGKQKNKKTSLKKI